MDVKIFEIAKNDENKVLAEEYRRGMQRLTRIEKLNANTIAQNKNWRKITRKIRRQIIFCYFCFFNMNKRFLGDCDYESVIGFWKF